MSSPLSMRSSMRSISSRCSELRVLRIVPGVCALFEKDGLLMRSMLLAMRRRMYTIGLIGTEFAGAEADRLTADILSAPGGVLWVSS